MQVQLQQAGEELPSEPPGEGPSSLSMLLLLLKAQYYYSTGKVGNECADGKIHVFFLPLTKILLTTFKVAEGVPLLCDVLKQVNERRQSKSWYLLRARALQTCSAYLNLDTAVLPQAERRLVAQHGEWRETLCRQHPLSVSERFVYVMYIKLHLDLCVCSRVQQPRHHSV